MRVGTVSAICALLSLIFTPSPGAAQSNPESRQTPQVSPQKKHEVAKLFELPNNAGDGKDQFQNDLAGRSGSPQQPPKVFVFLPDGEGKLAIVPPSEAPNCAHIIVFQAPETDSEMAVEAPPGTGGNITTFKGLQPCARDFRFALRAQQLPGLFFRRRGPFFQRPFEQFPSGQPASDKPKQNEGPAAKP